jgi:hypothetical protein
MKMTSDLASAVASVAPVFLLLGTVELTQAEKRLTVRREDKARQFRAASEAISAAADAVQLAEARRLRSQIPRAVGEWGLRIVASMWLLVSGWLLFATVGAIAWLAGTDIGFTSAQLAAFSYYGIAVGAGAVVFIPMSFTVRDRNAAALRMAEAKAMYDLLEDEATARIAAKQASTGALSG